MSVQYDLYLERHKVNVHNGLMWIRENLPDLPTDGVEWQTEFAHDASKSNPDEYEAYDKYFYGGNRSYKVVQDFNKAWLLHIHRNPHHWQYWVLINDEPGEGMIVLDMPYNYILEMICDWWAFSWQKKNLFEIFNWYDEHKDYMKLSDKTRKTVEKILTQIKEKLTENASESELMHHGIPGQKWGVKNGPPYPIDRSTGNGKIVHQKPVQIAEEKFTQYALDPDRSPDKARAFKEALGYTKDNYQELMKDIEENLDENKLEEKGDKGHGMRYQQIMRLTGPNEKEANVLTAWVEENDDFRLTSAYITKKEESK